MVLTRSGRAAVNSLGLRALAVEELLEERLGLRQDLDLDVGVGLQAGQLLGLGHGVVQGADLVDQAELLGLPAGVDAALGEGFQPVIVHLAARGGLAHELVVGLLEQLRPDSCARRA